MRHSWKNVKIRVLTYEKNGQVLFHLTRPTITHLTPVATTSQPSDSKCPAGNPRDNAKLVASVGTQEQPKTFPTKRFKPS
ncbi:hypothetical protein QQF64_034319 [Cirrhinus molitorella]|uniref:Uncharacterized protein n=1 Tax=Cirrhinus molitorella TaxID=172907 RepID=A0ABR3L351_9TELE